MLAMLRWIQTMRNPLLDHFFIGVTILGEEYFAIAVICLILWCVNKKAGYRIGFAYISSWILNFSLKEIIHLPRPFELDKRIIPLRPETATGYSFPSGHTQSLTSLVTAVMLALKKKWMYLPGILLIFLIAGSRLYLGVHTLLDVTGGALLGISWIFAANIIFDYAESTGRKAVFLIITVPMLVGMVFILTNEYYKIAGTFTGLMLGYFLDSFYIKYQVQGNIRQRFVNYILGIAVLLLIKTLVKKVLGDSLPADFLRYFLIGTWITVLAPMLFNKMWRKGSKYTQRSEQSGHTKTPPF
ncbi:phosphatase PAP2 family protein [Desulfosporosinus orientis]|nr:phosphatase PAP2 family protein [Desulfosporosinus orientis]